MKRFLLSMVLALGVVFNAQATSVCYPGSPANVGPVQFRYAAYLNSWWLAHPATPTPIGVAILSSNDACKVMYGTSAWGDLLGPLALMGTTPGTLVGSVTFQCKKCVYDR
jgi:hypothetical protein